MEKIHNLPAWFDLDHAEHPNWFPPSEFVFAHDGKYYFEGMLAYLLRDNKVPHHIHVALDMRDWSCLARLQYGDGSDEHAAFTPFEIESFALLWNSAPSAVHGFDSSNITLSIYEDHEVKYPFAASAGVICNLFFRDGIFRAEPDLESAEFSFGKAA